MKRNGYISKFVHNSIKDNYMVWILYGCPMQWVLTFYILDMPFVRLHFHRAIVIDRIPSANTTVNGIRKIRSNVLYTLHETLNNNKYSILHWRFVGHNTSIKNAMNMWNRRNSMDDEELLRSLLAKQLIHNWFGHMKRRNLLDDIGTFYGSTAVMFTFDITVFIIIVEQIACGFNHSHSRTRIAL